MENEDMTSNLKMPGGSGVGEATDQQPFSGPLESPRCASYPASLAPGDGHRACFRCLGAEHAAAALVASAACRTLPKKGAPLQAPLFLPVGGSR